MDPARSGRLHILEVQRLIRFMPKVVICVVPGWAAGGGHSLHVVSDLTLASRQHARFKQTDADVASFDGGFGSAYLARQVGQKFAREIFFLGDEYSAEDAHRMGMVNAVVDHEDLEDVALEWGSKINAKSPTAQRMLKYSFNLIDDGLVGQQLFAGEATRLAYMTDEAQEGTGLVPGQARPGLVTLPLALLSRDRVTEPGAKVRAWGRMSAPGSAGVSDLERCGALGAAQAQQHREAPQHRRSRPATGALQPAAASHGVGGGALGDVQGRGADEHRPEHVAGDRVAGDVVPLLPGLVAHRHRTGGAEAEQHEESPEQVGSG